jgi:hypothetical protein
MKLLITVLVVPLALLAGSVSQWSGQFLLTDHHSVRSESYQISGNRNVFGISASPNPFNPSVSLTVTGVMPNERVSIKIFNVRGTMVADVSSLLRPGSGTVRWDAGGVPSGLYVAQIKSGTHTKNLRLALVK